MRNPFRRPARQAAPATQEQDARRENLLDQAEAIFGATGTPHGAALAAELHAGRERARERGEQDPGPLHAHEVTPDDAALMRMLAGAHFGPAAAVTLPSGRRVTGAEMQQWVGGHE